MNTTDFDEALEHYHRAAGEFVKGDPEPYKRVFSHREDVSLANPFGPVVRGWKQVAESFLPHLPTRHLLDRETVLPGATGKSFWLNGSCPQTK